MRLSVNSNNLGLKLKTLNLYSNKINLDLAYKWLIIFVPFTIIIGNFALNINVILIDIIFIYLLIKGKIQLNRNILYFFSFASIIFFINISLSSSLYLSSKASLGVLKFLIFFLAFLTFLRNSSYRKTFFKILFYLLLLVTIDVLIQYGIGFDIFGNEYSTAHGRRLSGPFGDEYVVGAYLSKLFLLGIPFLSTYTKNYNFYVLYLLLIITTIFLTQERSAFFISLLATTFFIIFFKAQIKYKLFLFLSLIIVITIFIKFDESSFKKYINQTILQLGFSKELHLRYSNNKKMLHNLNTFWDSRYGAHFLTAYEIFKDNKIFGSGVKTFRKNCSLSKYENIDSKYADRRCNTHPHNIYYEILSEGGILMFVPFCFIIIYLLLSNIKILLKRYDVNILVNISLLIIFFFPIQTTGSFFSTFNGVFYWIALAVILNNMKLDIFVKSF